MTGGKYLELGPPGRTPALPPTSPNDAAPGRVVAWYVSLPPLTEVLTTGEARAGLAHTLRRFRSEGSAAAPLIFGFHRRPEAVVIPFQLYADLIPVIEDLQAAQQVRDRSAAGQSVPLADVAARVGLDPGSYR